MSNKSINKHVNLYREDYDAARDLVLTSKLSAGRAAHKFGLVYAYLCQHVREVDPLTNLGYLPRRKSIDNTKDKEANTKDKDANTLNISSRNSSPSRKPTPEKNIPITPVITPQATPITPINPVPTQNNESPIIKPTPKKNRPTTPKPQKNRPTTPIRKQTPPKSRPATPIRTPTPVKNRPTTPISPQIKRPSTPISPALSRPATPNIKPVIQPLLGKVFIYKKCPIVTEYQREKAIKFARKYRKDGLIYHKSENTIICKYCRCYINYREEKKLLRHVNSHTHRLNDTTGM